MAWFSSTRPAYSGRFVFSVAYRRRRGAAERSKISPPVACKARRQLFWRSLGLLSGKRIGMFFAALYAGFRTVLLGEVSADGHYQGSGS
ncbi:hypothetical protein [Rhodocyclus tenuis]|uniref:Uncharacterized protein n=1 Tax=Rhodocyclus tenuis TaxID=1066 RepID=A0A840G4V0_RHOTE|nr:hypothetical protein [Rhodocyclus tenuis]MBB4246935.1 hypothetical protein [Rhodocyclus tenuis]